ncbi:DoxX family protein [Prescottella defluvii]|uniref:DoxX family protein n=1 Tax=Prescottella defluvii TaxID=1323361 RepID=UPI0004F32187|nr:DoxX family protein [Prescottella defluvii]
MFIAYAVVAVLLTLALTASAFLTATRNEQVTTSMRNAGAHDSWFPKLAALKALGAIGLVVGLWVPWIGVAAAIGVTLYFIGAVTMHLRAGDKNIGGAAFLGLLAVAAIVLRLISV